MHNQGPDDLAKEAKLRRAAAYAAELEDQIRRKKSRERREKNASTAPDGKTFKIDCGSCASFNRTSP